jgi:hypothetical protein
MARIFIFLLLLVVISSPGALADSALEARVVNVLSGDMLVVSIDGRAEIVHLYCVQCPKRGEAGWLKARNYTQSMVLHKKIVVEPVGPKEAETIQAKVYVGDRCINDALVGLLLAGKQGQDPSY